MKKILIIEDDTIVSTIYRRKYEAAGYNVETAEDGESGLLLVNKFHPDLIQLDLLLPRLNGAEVIRRLRSRPEFKDLPIVVLSNCYAHDLLKAAWQAGATRCLSKINCTPKIVLECVAELLAFAPASASPSSADATPVPSPSVLAGEGISQPTVQNPPPPTISSPQPVLALGKAEPSHAPHKADEDYQKQVSELRPVLLQHVHALSKTPVGAGSRDILIKLGRCVHTWAAYAGLYGCVRAAHLTNALEAFLQELNDKPAKINASSLRTVTKAIDALIALPASSEAELAEPLQSTLIMAVDDELISRQTLISALRKVHLRCVSLGDPTLALRVLEGNQFDLIFLDIDMPEVNGLELCKKIRALPEHKATPIVFVTGLTDFSSRAQTVLSGGNDLIAKPFPLMELAVKSLTYLVNSLGAQSKIVGPMGKQ